MLHRIVTALAAVALLSGCDAAPTELVRTPEAPSMNTLSAFVHGSDYARVGDTCLYEAFASGGSAPYTYRWGTILGGWDWSADPNSSLWSVTFNSVGWQTVVVDVTDALGTRYRASLNVNVTGQYQGQNC
jgi:hypothetical protein